MKSKVKPPPYKQELTKGGPEIDYSKWGPELKELKDPSFADVPQSSPLSRIAQQPMTE